MTGKRGKKSRCQNDNTQKKKVSREVDFRVKKPTFSEREMPKLLPPTSEKGPYTNWKARCGEKKAGENLGKPNLGPQSPRKKFS